MQAEAAEDKPARTSACIMLFLEGGPSTIDMWDLKPEAPAEIRGPYRQIATTVPGTFFGEHQPLCAQIADKFTVLRSHSHDDNGHSTGYHYAATGYRAEFVDGNARVPTNVLYPSMGSIVSKELGIRGTVPPYLNIPNPMGAGGPGFYGAEHAPFVIESDPVQPDFEVRDLYVHSGRQSARFQSRRQALADFESLQRGGQKSGRRRAMSTYYEKAYDLITSPTAQRAFDIGSESEQVRREYGYTSLGQCALMARRLIQAGCRFIGIDHGSWDTHFDCFPSQEKDLFPHADRAFAALVNDLDQRGLLESTLVVMMGEMGRTPLINYYGGRDHWGDAWSMGFAGCGIKPGVVLGKTNDLGTEVVDREVDAGDLFHTFLAAMNLDPTATYQVGGRENPVADPASSVIKEVLA